MYYSNTKSFKLIVVRLQNSLFNAFKAVVRSRSFRRDEPVEVLLVDVLTELHEVLVLADNAGESRIGQRSRQDAEEMAEH